MILLIQVLSLLFYVVAFFWVLSLYRQILRTSGPYYLAFLRMGKWVQSFLKYATQLVLIVFVLQISYIAIHILREAL